MVSVIMRTYERWGIEIDINWIRLSSCAAFDFGCSCEWELSLWEANRQSNRARSSKRSLVNIGYEKQRITHRKCEIWARVSEIEWQNIWGQSCCSAIQYDIAKNVWNFTSLTFHCSRFPKCHSDYWFFFLVIVSTLFEWTAIPMPSLSSPNSFTSNSVSRIRFSLFSFFFSYLPTSPVTFLGVWESKYGSLIIVAWVKLTPSAECS